MPFVSPPLAKLELSPPTKPKINLAHLRIVLTEKLLTSRAKAHFRVPDHSIIAKCPVRVGPGTERREEIAALQFARRREGKSTAHYPRASAANE